MEKLREYIVSYNLPLSPFYVIDQIFMYLFGLILISLIVTPLLLPYLLISRIVSDH